MPAILAGTPTPASNSSARQYSASASIEREQAGETPERFAHRLGLAPGMYAQVENA